MKTALDRPPYVTIRFTSMIKVSTSPALSFFSIDRRSNHHLVKSRSVSSCIPFFVFSLSFFFSFVLRSRGFPIRWPIFKHVERYTRTCSACVYIPLITTNRSFRIREFYNIIYAQRKRVRRKNWVPFEIQGDSFFPFSPFQSLIL